MPAIPCAVDGGEGAVGEKEFCRTLKRGRVYVFISIWDPSRRCCHIDAVS